MAPECSVFGRAQQQGELWVLASNLPNSSRKDELCINPLVITLNLSVVHISTMDVFGCAYSYRV